MNPTVLVVLSVLLAAPVAAQTPFLKMAPVADGSTEAALERIDGCLGGIAQRTTAGNWLCTPGDALPTDTPLTCSTGLQGVRYLDLSMGQSCFCDGTNWCTVSGGACGSPTSCGTTASAAASANCPATEMEWIPTLTIPAGTSVFAGDSTAARAECARFTQPCTKTITQMASRVLTISPGQQLDQAIYSNDGTTLLTHLGAKDLSATGILSTTGLSATLVARTQYFYCQADSESTNTARISGFSAETTLGNGFAGTNNTFARGATASGNLAQFVAQCTARSAPYACCEGSVADGTIASFGTPSTLTSASNPFVAGDVGAFITVAGAGAAGVLLLTTITAFNNAGSVQIATSSTNVAGVATKWGTCNGFTNALGALNAAATNANMGVAVIMQ